MAESYIITIKFTPTSQSLKETEKKLNSTFDRVVNRFKNGFGKAWKGLKIGASIAAMGTALTALLNPLAQLNERINATLDKAGNIKDRADSAKTDIKSYLALWGYTRSKGISEESLLQAMSRMQVLVGEAKAGNENVLSNYAGETDMGKVFYNVIQNIAKVSKVDAAKGAKLANDVFGRGAIAQLGPLISEGFVRKDFDDLFSGKDLNAAEAAVKKLDEKGDLAGKLQVKREIDDLINKGNEITEDTIYQQDANARAALKLEDKQMAAYSSLSTIETSIIEIKALLSNIYLLLSPAINIIKKSLEGLSMFPQFFEETKYVLDGLKDKFDKFFSAFLKSKSMGGGGGGR